MIYSADIKRISNSSLVDYLNVRIEALERRVEELEIKLELEKNKPIY